MTNKQLIKEWIEKHEIVGKKGWWDGKIYYSLTVAQICSIAKYINSQGTIKKGGEQ